MIQASAMNTEQHIIVIQDYISENNKKRINEAVVV